MHSQVSYGLCYYNINIDEDISSLQKWLLTKSCEDGNFSAGTVLGE